MPSWYYYWPKYHPRNYVLLVVMLGYGWWLCIVIHISVQYNVGLLPDIIMLTHPWLLPLGNPFKYHVVCVCVFFPSILDIKFVGRTSRGHTGGRSHRIFNPPSFCGACLDFCREKDSVIPFPRRPWSRILCTNELIVLHPLGIFILVF